MYPYSLLSVGRGIAGIRSVEGYPRVRIRASRVVAEVFHKLARLRRSRIGSSRFGLGQEEVHAQSLGQVFRHELPLDAVAGRIQGWREGAQPTLAGRNGDDATTNAALARQPDVIKPVTGGFV